MYFKKALGRSALSPTFGDLIWKLQGPEREREREGGRGDQPLSEAKFMAQPVSGFGIGLGWSDFYSVTALPLVETCHSIVN